MNEILDEITEIPFDIFWEKYLSQGGMNFWKTRANAVWWMLNENEREKAFKHVCNNQVNDPCYEILRRYYESDR